MPIIHWKIRLLREIAQLTKLDQSSSIKRKIARLKRKLITNPNGKNQQHAKTHCPKGHKFTEDSVYILKSGAKRCAICHKNRSNKRYAEKVKKVA